MRAPARTALAAALSALTLGAMAPAKAADIDVVLPSLAASQTWHGVYFGAFVGFGGSHGDADTQGSDGFEALIPGGIVPNALDAGSDGFLGGLTAGFNHSFGRVVLGAEADFALTSLSGSDSFTGNPVLGTRLNTRLSQDYNYFGTLRARLGYAPFHQLMVFATAGLAFAHIETDARITGIDNTALVWDGTDESVELGWTVGAGAEFLVTETISIKADVLYYDLSDSAVTAGGNAAVRGVTALDGIDYRAEADNAGVIGRIGLNYHF